MGRQGVQRNVEPFFTVAQLNSSAGLHKSVLIGPYTPYIFEIIDSNIILRCLRRSRQHQSFELRCHLFLMSSPPLSSHPWMCGVWPSCFSSVASQNARSRSFFVRAELAPTRRCDDPKKELITTIGVKSIITQPNDDTERMSPGVHMIPGYAWSGAGAIDQVDVSVDGGETWHSTHIEQPRDRFMWVRWS